MKGSIRFCTLVLAVILAMCLVGCGSTSGASKPSASTSSSNSASVSSSTSKASSSQAASESQQPSSKSGGVEVDSKFLGHWIGYDMFTQDTIDSPMLLSDLDMSATLDVDASGIVSVELITDGEREAFQLRMEKGKSGNGYTLYDDEYDRVDGALEYGAKNGPVSWLVFSEYGSDGTLYSFSFYQED